MQHVMRIVLAATAGVSPVLGQYRDQANSKNRIDATVSAGLRTAVALDAT